MRFSVCTLLRGRPVGHGSFSLFSKLEPDAGQILPGYLMRVVVSFFEDLVNNQEFPSGSNVSTYR